MAMDSLSRQQLEHHFSDSELNDTCHSYSVVQSVDHCVNLTKPLSHDTIIRFDIRELTQRVAL